jgi:deoxyribodipyrimidine photo-lyase
LYGANFSCKISPWLAMGCLSPRRMFEDLKKDGPRWV